jgi:hypothetical protein
MDRRLRRAAAVALALSLPVLFAACAASVGPSTSPSPSPSPGDSPSPVPSPSPGERLTPAELRLRLLIEFGSLWYCDPDVYPVSRGDEQQLALETFPEIVADADTYLAIAAALGLDPDAAEPPPEAQLAVYRLWKRLVAIELPTRGDLFAFDELFGPKDPAGQVGEHLVGTIDRSGTITVATREIAGPPMCPICLARGTPIDTPDGPRAVEALGVGDVVWSLDTVGRRIAVTVVAVGSAAVPASHQVVRLVLDDGRTVTASPGHPLTDRRPIGSLVVGDRVDGARVVAADPISYVGGRTFDIAVGGPTGLYLVDGIPLASTLDLGR